MDQVKPSTNLSCVIFFLFASPIQTGTNVNPNQVMILSEVTGLLEPAQGIVEKKKKYSNKLTLEAVGCSRHVASHTCLTETVLK